MKAVIINIGDEILIGQIINTNAAWMASELNEHGINIVEILSISDEVEQIKNSVINAMKKSDLVLITGGLGPTKDDITKKTLSDLFGMELKFHKPSFDNIVELFKQFVRYPDDRYKKQCEMPVGADILINITGTASGMWFEKDNTIIVSMPGVPKEMMYLIKNEVLPKLLNRNIIQVLIHSTIICYGKGETDLSDLLENFENGLPHYIKLAYLPNTSNGYIRLRLSARGHNKNSLLKELEKARKELRSILGSLVFGENDDNLERVVGEILRNKNLSISTAESCTGGKIAHKITSIPGCSSYFLGSVVAYSNESKINLLSVSKNTLVNHGAVSEETVREMASGAKAIFNSDYAIATSGIAGPDGGSHEKPVGTVWLAIAHPNGVFSKKLSLGNNRERNIEMSTNIALNSLRLILENEFEILKPTY